MLNLKNFRYRKISQNATVEDLVKESVRKLIHMSSAFSVLLAHFFFTFTVYAVLCGIIVYSVCELLRLNGIRVPLISKITEIASRKTDEGRFVLGPLCLGIGILLALLFFDESASAVAIFSLAFGDGLASLVGKIYGQKHFKVVSKKTLEGSIACFLAVFVSTVFVLKNPLRAFFLALIATFVEVLPLKNLDNIAIPLVVGFCASVLPLR